VKGQEYREGTIEQEGDRNGTFELVIEEEEEEKQEGEEERREDWVAPRSLACLTLKCQTTPVGGSSFRMVQEWSRLVSLCIASGTLLSVSMQLTF
jgi:hypothetical protein